MVKQRLAAIVDDEDFVLAAKVEKLNDEEGFENMMKLMREYMLEKPENAE